MMLTILLIVLIQAGGGLGGLVGIKADAVWQKIGPDFHDVYGMMHVDGTVYNNNIVVDPLNSDHLIMTAFMGSSRQSFDGGKTWEEIKVDDSFKNYDNTKNMLTTRIYLIEDWWYFNSWGSIYKTQDFKKYIQIVDFKDNSIDDFWTDGVVFYAGMRPGIGSNANCFFRSLDSGKTWENLSNGIRFALKDYPGYLGVQKIVIYKDKLFVGDEISWWLMSINGGDTFEKIMEEDYNKSGHGISPLIIVNDYLWSFSWVDLEKKNIMRSEDGVNWELLFKDSHFLLGSFGVDNRGVIYAISYIKNTVSICYSVDGGRSWILYNKGLSDSDFDTKLYSALMIRPAKDKLYFISGEGVYVNSLPPLSIVINLQIGNPYMIVNGDSQEIDPGRDTKPVIENSRTLVPIRAIVESLGGSIEWEEKERKVTIMFANKTIELWIGKSIAKVNGVDTPIDSANPKVVPVIINSRTMLPLRFIAENLGCKVNWEASSQTITIIYPNRGG